MSTGIPVRSIVHPELVEKLAEKFPEANRSELIRRAIIGFLGVDPSDYPPIKTGWPKGKPRPDLRKWKPREPIDPSAVCVLHGLPGMCSPTHRGSNGDSGGEK